jgi:hypothetical protein
VEDGNGNTSQRIKIIKDEKLSSYMEWDSNTVNEWTTASLNAYLNGDYYNGLSSTAKEMIEPAKTYLGGRRYDDTTHYGTAEDMYAWERGTNRNNASRSLNDTKNISLIYPSDYTYTYAKGIDNTCYSDGYNCDQSNPSSGWLYKSSYYWWTVSPLADYSYDAFYVNPAGFVHYDYALNTYGVRPVTYLISDISFEGNHTGSSTDHYVLKK